MNRHLSDRAKRAKLVSSDARIAKKINSLANPSRERVERLVDLLIDHETKAAWKAKGEGRREGKNEAIAPGTPTVAGFILKIESDLERLENRRLKSVQRFRIELDTLVDNAENRLRNFEFPDETLKNKTLKVGTDKISSPC